MAIRRRLVLAAATIMAAVGVYSLAYYAFNQPTRLTIAVGPSGSEDARIVEAIAQRLQNRRENIQLKIIYKEGSAASSEALDTGKADLAVIRSDLSKQPNAGLVATLHRDPVIILANRASGIKKITDLRGRKLGILRATTGNTDQVSVNTELLISILAYYSIPESAVTLVPLTRLDVQKAIEEKRIEAIFIVGPLSDPAAAKIVDALSVNNPLGPQFIPISEPEALILKNPQLLKEEIIRGAFGGQPPKPSEAISTIAITHSIAASNNLSDAVVADLTRYIFKLRTVLARDVKLASRIEAPSTDKNAPMQMHTGAAAYIDNEEQSFMDKYGDWIYIAAMLTGFLGSAAAALFSRRSSDARMAALEHIEDSVNLMGDARRASTPEQVDAVEIQADKLVENVVRNAVQAHLNQTDLASFNITINQVRQAINDKRRLLVWNAPPPATEQPHVQQPANVQQLVPRAAAVVKSSPIG